MSHFRARGEIKIKSREVNFKIQCVQIHTSGRRWESLINQIVGLNNMKEKFVINLSKVSW